MLTMATMILSADPAAADPLRGEVLKFQQLPLDGAVVADRKWYGHDEVSTMVGKHRDALGPGSYTIGRFMADDFADLKDTPVVHIRWWGSYIDGIGLPDAAGVGGVNKFLVTFETDVPAGTVLPDGTVTRFSQPGVPLLSQIVDRGALAPASGTFTEKFKSPGGAPLNEALFEYNAELKYPFAEKHDTVYWLKIAALVDPSKDGDIRWGWHNRDWTVFDPLASTPPDVVPGEGPIGAVFDGIDPNGVLKLKTVYHFQDDAVMGGMSVVDFGGTQIDVAQFGYQPQLYIDGVDGPPAIAAVGVPGIGRFSKDLAFELYTVPEPGTLLLLGIGSALALAARHRRGRSV
jgi:hypothetical protein